jgi:arylsulfatase
MSDKATDVMIAAYLTKEPALVDYEAVINSSAKIDGAVCVHRDLEGNTSIEETDHLAKGGAKVLGGAGLVVGLFAPPLLLSTAVGAAAGAALGHHAHSKVKSKIEEQAAETIPWGGAGMIVAYPRSSAEEVDKAVTHALKKVVGEAEGKKVQALKAAMADAQEKLSNPAAAPTDA